MTMTEVSLIELHFAIWRAFRFVFLQNFLKKNRERKIRQMAAVLFMIVSHYAICIDGDSDDDDGSKFQLEELHLREERNVRISGPTQ